jgi:hypothetical protein
MHLIETVEGHKLFNISVEDAVGLIGIAQSLFKKENIKVEKISNFDLFYEAVGYFQSLPIGSSTNRMEPHPNTNGTEVEFSDGDHKYFKVVKFPNEVRVYHRMYFPSLVSSKPKTISELKEYNDIVEMQNCDAPLGKHDSDNYYYYFPLVSSFCLEELTKVLYDYNDRYIQYINSNS